MIKTLKELMDVMNETKTLLYIITSILHEHNMETAFIGHCYCLKLNNLVLKCFDNMCVLSDNKENPIARVWDNGRTERWDRLEGWVKDSTAIKEFERLGNIEDEVRKMRELRDLVNTMKTMIKVLMK